MSGVAFEMDGGAGRRLAEWLDRVKSRPLPKYTVRSGDDGAARSGPDDVAERFRQMGMAESEIARAVRQLRKQMSGVKHRAPEASTREPTLVEIVAPDAHSKLVSQWRAVFPLGRPMSVSPLP